MRLAPFGAFGAMGYIVAKNGIKTIGNLGLLIATLYVACLVFVFVVLWALARVHGFSLWKLLRYFREELLVVLGTSSTEPVLPAVLFKLERLGCSKGSVGLTLPLGYSFNLDGNAIYLTSPPVPGPGHGYPPLQLAGGLDDLRDAPHLQGGGRGDGEGFAALVATLPPCRTLSRRGRGHHRRN